MNEHEYRTIERTDEECQQIIDDLKKQGITDQYVPIEMPTSNYARLVDPHPIGRDVTSYSARLIASNTKYFPALGKRGYPSNQTVKDYETQSYFVEKTKRTNIFQMYTDAESVAKWWGVAIGAAKGWLNIAGVVVDAANRLQQAVEPVMDHAYYFNGGREVTMYDPITRQADVEVEKWGQGIYALTWDYSSSQGFTNAKWKMVGSPSSFSQSPSQDIDDACFIYNRNVEMYGSCQLPYANLGR